jgi:hypothetical protein
MNANPGMTLREVVAALILSNIYFDLPLRERLLLAKRLAGVKAARAAGGRRAKAAPASPLSFPSHATMEILAQISRAAPEKEKRLFVVWCGFSWGHIGRDLSRPKPAGRPLGPALTSPGQYGED